MGQAQNQHLDEFQPPVFPSGRLPTPGTRGRLITLEDGTRVTMVDTGLAWSHFENGTLVDKFGAKGNDSYDDIGPINDAFQAVSEEGGGYVDFDADKIYKVTAPIVQWENTVGRAVGGRNRHLPPGSYIHHVPTTADTDLFTLHAPAAGQSYLFNVGLENMYILSDGRGRRGVYWSKASHAWMKNIKIHNGFTDGVYLDYAHQLTLEDVESSNNDGRALFISADNGLSTTVEIIRGNYRESQDGIVMDTDAIYDLVCRGVTIEGNTRYPVNQYEGNGSFWFGGHTEANPVVSGAFPIFRVGIDGTSARGANDKGSIAIIGGRWMGTNDTVHADSSFMDVGQAHHIYIGGGADIGRFGKFMITTGNEKAIHLGDFTPITITDMTGGFNAASLRKILGYLPTASRNASIPDARWQANRYDVVYDSTKYHRVVEDSDGNLEVYVAGSGVKCLRLGADGSLSVPIMTTAQRDALTPTEAMFVFNGDTNKLNFYTGAAWEAVTSA